MNVRSCSSLSSHVIMFLLLPWVGVKCLALGPDKFLSRKVCAFLLWLQLCMFVFIVVSYTAGHGKECVTEMVRVRSAYFPLSVTAVVKAPP